MFDLWDGYAEQLMKENPDFSKIVKEVTERGGLWSQTRREIYIKPGIRDRLGQAPKAPITILRSPDNLILVERVNRRDVIHLLPLEMQGRIEQDALAVVITDEAGERVSIGNYECQFITGLNFDVVKGQDGLELARLYQEIESRTS